MNQARDIIYIDTDDDITVIVGKVKAAKNPAVALVPPKRVGVLQSSVNLKLVARAAHSAKKEISLITGDGALKALAALAGIPVAKTLAAEPVLAELPEDELEGDDVIRGEDLPVGEIAKSQPPQRRQVSQRAESNSNSSRGKAQPEDKELSAAVAKLDDEINSDGDTDKPSSKKAKAQKIPNFKKFRKWLLLIVPLAILVVAFLVWAIGFAPRATIAITAKTSDKTVAATVTLDPNGTTNTDTELLAATQKTSQKTATAKFDATGSKQVGDKATGTVVIYASMDAVPLTFQSGTTLMSDGGLQFTLGKTVSFGDSIKACGTTTIDSQAFCTTTAPVTASQVGDSYNISANTNFQISGYGSSSVYAVAQSAFTGGSSKTVKVVQQSDLDAAAAKLTTDNSDSAKADLTGQFGKGFTVIDSSFNAAAGTPTSTPAVGAELDSGQATVSLTTTYTMLGLNNADLNNLLNSQALAGVDNSANQKVYDNGLSNLKFSNYNALDGGKASVRLIATAKVGPKLDEDKIKQESVGLRAGEIQQLLSKTDGVDSVNVHFSPFWVNKAPKVDKITVEFDVSK